MIRVAPILLLLFCVSGCRQAAPVQQNATSGNGGPGAASTSGSLTAPVLETMDAAPYTYVRVKGETGDVWAAAPQFAVKVGDRVVVPLEMPMKNFHSQTLNRDFPVVYFAARIAREGDTQGSAAAPPQMMSGHAAAATPSEPIAAMPAPEGGRTIADVWANRKTLAGRSVTVRGKVVKFNSGILGHNWVHLQDGSGAAADGSNDITVTVAEDLVLRVGDTVTVTGTLALDKDFGAGYSYPVIIENGRPAAQSR